MPFNKWCLLISDHNLSRKISSGCWVWPGQLVKLGELGHNWCTYIHALPGLGECTHVSRQNAYIQPVYLQTHRQCQVMYIYILILPWLPERAYGATLILCKPAYTVPATCLEPGQLSSIVSRFDGSRAVATLCPRPCAVVAARPAHSSTASKLSRMQYTRPIHFGYKAASV